jgi:4-alpha-glucanotransferase
MIDPDLRRLAEAAGIAPVYRNWRGENVEVSSETLTAILAALDEVPESPGQQHTAALKTGRAAPEQGGRAAPEQPAVLEQVAGQSAAAHAIPVQAERPNTDIPRVPAGQSWGFTVQLYSLRSRASWGHGDLRDLADLASWSARELGANFVLANPLHAAEPLPPISASPYLPMSRMFVSPLYLRIEDIPEYGELPARDRDRIEQLAAPLRASNASSDLIDRDAVWTAKRAALEIISQVPLTGQRLAAYQLYCQREGTELDSWATWCALAQLHGPDWRSWPSSARDPESAAEARAAGRLGGQPAFHAWLQWLLDEQLATAQQAALAAGMGIGIIHDLAVGAHPSGADAWAHQDLLVSGLSVGAPPDEFNQQGQDWTQPPWHPQRLGAAGYRPLASLFAVALRNAGGLRADHVMGLMRLWCVPAGMPPDRGAYVLYDHRASVAALAGEAARAGAVAIGEDLGTVEPWFHRYLAENGIMGTSLLWFAREADGTPLRPQHWRRACMATVGTHDLPPVSGFLTGEQVTVRARLGLLEVPEDAERKSAKLMLSRWQDALEREGLLAGSRAATGLAWAEASLPGAAADRPRAAADRPGAGPGRPGAAADRVRTDTASSRAAAAEFTVALYAYLARTPAALVGVSLADAVGDCRTQNVPGTSDEYPNWRIPLCDSEHRAVLLEDLPALPLVRAVARAAAGR